MLCALFVFHAVHCQVEAPPEERPAPDYRVYPTLDEQKKFPFNGCLLDYVNCTNLCKKTKQNCCYCESCFSNMMGVTQTCTCCPKGYKCCKQTPPTVGQPQKCCPTYTDCGPANSPYCVQYYKPIYQDPVCQHCSDWTWPPRVYTLEEVNRNENVTEV
jgi:hypothetical protein